MTSEHLADKMKETVDQLEQEVIGHFNKPPSVVVDPKSRYYDAGGIEVLDIVKAKLTPEQLKGYFLGNIIKYSLRANWKENFDRDIEKIGMYQSFLKECLSEES